ncbi:MAG: ABC transporter substrate-binding protein [Candidatus Riflebacteria bacterium]|nr:ABC transporter substrate-binding protein [Candidatus Riflebacteria bacterium]
MLFKLFSDGELNAPEDKRSTLVEFGETVLSSDLGEVLHMIRLLLRTIFLLFAILFSAGCGEAPPVPGGNGTPAAESKVPVYGGTFRRAFPSPVITLDPRAIGDSFSHEVARQIFDGLVEFDPEARVVPAIAESWKVSSDRLTYTIKLRNDIRFHATFGAEGRPTNNGGRLLTAEDVSYSFHRLLDPKTKMPRGKLFLVIKGSEAYAAGSAPNISGIQVLASDSIAISLEKPFAPFLSLLALPNAFIVPREDAERPNFGTDPVGTGPFISSGKQGDTLILKANQNYFRGRPYLDRLEFPFIKEEKDSFAMFKRGELMETNVPDPEYKNVKSDPLLAPLFQETSRWGTYYLGMNVTKPPFDNVKVRQAINFAIDRETIVKLILNDRARIAKGVLPPGITAFNPALRGYSYDPERAKKLLAEAGYPDGKGFPEITLQFNRDPSHERSSEFILANLRDIGITCILKEVEFPEHFKSVENGEVSFFRMGWTVDYPDPDNFLYTLFHSKNIGREGNFARYSNPKVDELVERARFEIDPKDRIPLYQRAEQMIVDDAPWVFIYHYTTHVLPQANVRGLHITTMGAQFILYRQIWLVPQSQGQNQGQPEPPKN